MPSTAKRDPSFRNAVLRKDNYTCQGSLVCRLKGARPAGELEADHVVRLADAGPDDPRNGQTLCIRHHREKSARELRKRVAPWRLVLHAGCGVVAVGGAATVVTGAFAYVSAADLAQWAMTARRWWLAGLLVWMLLIVLTGPGRWWWRAGADSATHQVAESTEPTTSPAARLQDKLAPVFSKDDVWTVTPTKNGSLTVDYSATKLADESEDTRIRVLDIAAAKLGGRWRADWQTEQDRVVLYRRHSFPPTVPHPGFPLGAQRPWHVLPAGVDEHGTEWSFQLMTTAHLLITGTTGKGKTSLLRAVVAALIDSASRGEVEIHMLDPKRVELMRYRISPHVAAVHTDDEDMYDAILAAHAVMQQRYAEAEGTPDPVTGEAIWPANMRPYLLVIDELRELYGRLDDVARGRGEKVNGSSLCEARRALMSIAQLGRTALVRLIESTQRADARWLGGDFRELIEGRAFVGPSPDGVSAAMLFGSRLYARDIPASALGRATIQVGESTPVEIQSYYVP